ncbi:MAG TPA: discoidin domain-containing protein, partial [Ktedonobacteraceae bacterium]
MQQQRHRYFIVMVLLSSLLVGVFSSLIVFQHTALAGTGEPAGSNIAVGTPASADSQQSSQPASSGNDGDATTFWCAADGNVGHWWQTDLRTYSNLTG